MRTPLTPAELGFEAADRKRLSRAVAQAVEARCLRRFQAVLFVAEGRSFVEAAHLHRFELALGLSLGDILFAVTHTRCSARGSPHWTPARRTGVDPATHLTRTATCAVDTRLLQQRLDSRTLSHTFEPKIRMLNCSMDLAATPETAGTTMQATALCLF